MGIETVIDASGRIIPDQHETQQTIGGWARETFPGGDSLSPRHCIRLFEEVIELCLAAGAHIEDLERSFDMETLRWIQRHRAKGVDYERFPEPDKVPEELADCAIVLDVLAERRGIDLRTEVDRKMAINRARKWNVKGDGTGYHTED